MKILDKIITLGADPEIFVGRGGQFFSAHGLVPGDKRRPHPVTSGAVQVDGMALEFNIDPASSYEEFQSNLDTVQAQLKGMIGDAEFLNVASVIFSKEFLKDIPYENVRLGCEPDFDGYAQGTNDSPNQDALMRTAGGHVHVGGLDFDMDDPAARRNHFRGMCRLTRVMDEEVGVYSILWDKDDQRRKLYGKAGCFRPKVYGMEYRSMSNAWIFNKELVRFVYDSTIDAVTKFLNGGDATDLTAKEVMDQSVRDHEFFRNNAKADRVRAIVGAA